MALALPVAGCATFSAEPVAEHVVTCRERCQHGMEAMQRGNWDEADRLFATAVQSCPVDERARRNYAEALWQQGRQDAAVNQMEEAVRLSGGLPKTFVRLGEMYLAQRRLAAAQECAANAIARDPSLPEGWALEGDVLQRRGDLIAALARYHRALACRPEYSHAQLQAAGIYYLQARHQRVLATLDGISADAASDESRRMLILKGLSCKVLGRYAEAAQLLAAAAAAPGATPDELYELGDAQLLAGLPENARLTAEQALALNPRHSGNRQLLARANAARGHGGPTELR